jgi:hypothetical protein
MTEENTPQPNTEPHDWEKFWQTGKLISEDDADRLVTEGSSESIPGFMGAANHQSVIRDKKGRIKFAEVHGTKVHEGEMHATTIDLRYPGLFARGLAILGNRPAHVAASITETISALTQEQLEDPANPYQALYDKGKNDE